MIEFYQGESIPLILPLVEYSTGAAIDTDDLSGATILVQDPDGETLKQGTLTAEDETTTQDWIVTVTEADAPDEPEPAGNAKRGTLNGKVIKYNGQYIEF